MRWFLQLVLPRVIAHIKYNKPLLIMSKAQAFQVSRLKGWKMMDKQHSKQRHDSTVDHIASAQPLCIGPSIWMIKERCSRTWQSNLGLVQFNTDSNTFSDIILFPLSLKNTEDWLWLSSCKYKDDSIVIVDGDRGHLIVFNTTTRTFVRIIVLKQQIGSHPNCIAIGDYVHSHFPGRLH